MPLTKPLNNNCLIEVIKEHAAVSRFDGDNASMSTGKLIDFRVGNYHLTASAAIQIDKGTVAGLRDQLESMLGKIVRWEEFAEGGQTFEEDGKTYALIPWWRLISVMEEQ